MFTSAPCVFSVSHQARCISALTACTEKHRFVVGTCSPKPINELSILEYDEENNQLDAKVVCSHPNQIWAIEPSPTDPSLVLTSSKQRDGSNPVALYRLPSDDADAVPDDDDRGYGYGKDIKPLEEIAQLSFADSAVFVNSFAWHKARNTVLTLDPASLTMWDIRESGIVASATALATAQDISNMDVGIYSGGAVAWDPHHANLCAMVSDGSLSIIDTRKMTALSSIHKVHRGVARDVDYNSNKPQSIITCGDDRKVKLWDLRAMKSPVSTLEGHSHWVWQAKYNPFHDQLIVSSGSDNLVNLWRVASCSSAPWLGDGLAELEDEEDGDTRGDNDDSEDPPDVRIKTMDQHEECVYSCAWSAAEAWMYCSLSFEGRVILNHVPSTEKYKILL